MLLHAPMAQGRAGYWLQAIHAEHTGGGIAALLLTEASRNASEAKGLQHVRCAFKGVNQVVDLGGILVFSCQPRLANQYAVWL